MQMAPMQIPSPSSTNPRCCGVAPFIQKANCQCIVVPCYTLKKRRSVVKEKGKERTIEAIGRVVASFSSFI